MTQKRDSSYPGRAWTSKTVNTSVAMSGKDVDDLDWLVSFFGSNRSEVARTCVRALALSVLSSQGGKK